MQPRQNNIVSVLPTLRELLLGLQSPTGAYLLAAFIAVAFVFYLYPLSFLAGHGAYFEQGDASQHVTGWLFFASDTWHFPLLHTGRLNYPDGTAIVFTDSIPLAALFFKIIASWLPLHFHYIGLWHGVAFVTQAIAATFLIRALGARSLLAMLCAVIFALTWPALLWRIGHTSLMTHGIILSSLAFYFLGRSHVWSSNVTTLAFTVISVIGLLVHPYFLAFCYALMLAFLADQVIAGERWTTQIPRLLAPVVIIGVLAGILGYFGNSTVTFGFGEYSMNLTAPFCGSRYYACASDPSSQIFAAFHIVDGTGGQYEGFNYFGFGLFLLLPFAIATHWKEVIGLPKKYPALLIMMLMCTVYAISNRVFFATTELFSYPLPSFMDRLTGTFRASGRFFWMVGYLILFGVLGALLRRPSWRIVALMAFALLLQWKDTKPLRHNISVTANRQAQDDLTEWAGVLAKIDKIHVYPAFGCGANDGKVYLFFQRLAAHYEKLLDTGYIARPATICADNDKAFAGKLQPRSLYVMSASYLKNPFTVIPAFADALHQNECVVWKELVLCQKGLSPDDWKNVGLQGTYRPVMTKKDKVEWPASELPTRIGQLVDGRLATDVTSAADYLSFGPYISISPGRYRFVIRYSSPAERTRPVGRWDIVIGNGSEGPRELMNGVLAGTDATEEQIEGVFSVDKISSPLEIRTFYSGSGGLQLTAISLERAP